MMHAQLYGLNGYRFGGSTPVSTRWLDPEYLLQMKSKKGRSQNFSMARAPLLLPYVPAQIMKRLGTDDAEAWLGKSWLMPSKNRGFFCEACRWYAKQQQQVHANFKARVFRIDSKKLHGKSLKLSNLMRHHQSASHLQAVVARVQQQSGAVGGLDLTAAIDFPGAPGREEFRKVWKALRDGQAPSRRMESGCQPGKVRRMLTCLGEAMFQMDRAFLEQPGVVFAMHRDEKSGRLQIDFTACDQALRVRSGVLGLLGNEGGTLGIVATTRAIMKQFFTDIHGRFSETGFKQFAAAVELINTDAAPDEIAACREQSKPSLQCMPALTPNIKVVARDKAHGSQRPAAA